MKRRIRIAWKARSAFNLLPRVDRYWGGKLLYIHWLGLPALVIDRREDVLGDMMDGGR
jgi:hypothetical protein